MPPTKAAVSLFPLMPSWKGHQIFINIPINKAKLQSSPCHHTEGSNGHGTERQKGWRWGEGGLRLFGWCHLSHNIQEQMGNSVTWSMIVKVHSLMLCIYWLLQMHSRVRVSPPGPLSLVYVNVADWGNVIKWLKDKVRTWISTMQSIVLISQQNKKLSWLSDLNRWPDRVGMRMKQQV